MTEEPSGDILAHGPIHKLTVEFELNRFRGELLPELDRLKELGIIRIIDLLAVRKDRTVREVFEITRLTTSSGLRSSPNSAVIWIGSRCPPARTSAANSVSCA